jgi:hypothetical protein
MFLNQIAGDPLPGDESESLVRAALTLCHELSMVLQISALSQQKVFQFMPRHHADQHSAWCRRPVCCT